MWMIGYGVSCVDDWLWSVVCGCLVMECCVWMIGYGVLSVDDWLWSVVCE